MKKSGFTLAEVLITLGIIGVVAALTAPALVMQSRNEANAAKLAVAVSNLENAFTTAITQENVDSLNQTSMFQAYNENIATGSGLTKVGKFVGQLKRYLHVTGYSDNTIGSYYTNGFYGMSEAGSKGTNLISSTWEKSFYPIYLKSGTTVAFNFENISNAGSTDTIRSKGGALFVSPSAVMIDVNGANEPNTFGRDMFLFRLGDDGILYPYGGTDTNVFLGQSGSATSRWNESNKTYSCLNGAIKGNGFGCTARVIEEGYKINY